MVLFCRSLGVENSFVLSCTLDDWTDEQVDVMASKGNKLVNEELEYSVPKTIEVPYEKTTERVVREEYIRAKYLELLFRKADGKSLCPPKRTPRKGSRSSRGSNSPTLRDAGMVEFIGIVDVHLIECQDLVIKDIVSSDPYVVLSIGLQKRKSTIKYNTLKPQYMERFQFSWDGHDPLILEVYDKDELSKDDHMGMAEISLSGLKKNPDKVFRGWHCIKHRKHRDKQQGEVLLELNFTLIQ